MAATSCNLAVARNEDSFLESYTLPHAHPPHTLAVVRRIPPMMTTFTCPRSLHPIRVLTGIFRFISGPPQLFVTQPFRHSSAGSSRTHTWLPCLNRSVSSFNSL